MFHYKLLRSIQTTLRSRPTNQVADAAAPVYSGERAALVANATSEVATTRLEHFPNASSINAKPVRRNLILTSDTTKPLDSCRTLLNTCEAAEHNIRSAFAADDRTVTTNHRVVAPSTPSYRRIVGLADQTLLIPERKTGADRDAPGPVYGSEGADC